MESRPQSGFESSATSRDFVVAQLGARMHYAVARILHEAGQLKHFHTDICASKGWISILNSVPRSLRSDSLRRLLDRKPRGIPSELVTAHTLFGLEYANRLRKARMIADRN